MVQPSEWVIERNREQRMLLNFGKIVTALVYAACFIMLAAGIAAAVSE